MPIVEVQIPSRSASKPSSLTEQDIQDAVQLLQAGKPAGLDATFKNRKQAQTAGWEFRNEIAARAEQVVGTEIPKENLRSTTFQLEDSDDPDLWHVAVFMKSTS